MITTVKDYEKLSEQYNKMLEERNTLIDDLSWYRAKVSRLERENECEKEWFYKYSCELEHIVKHERDTIKTLERENKNLRLQSDTYFEQWQNEKLTSQGLREQCKEYAQDASKFLNLLSEISQHIGNKPSSSTYKYFRAKLDNLNITEGK